MAYRRGGVVWCLRSVPAAGRRIDAGDPVGVCGVLVCRGFTATWVVADRVGLDMQSAIGFATVVATLILTPLGFWASKTESGPPPRPARR